MTVFFIASMIMVGVVCLVGLVNRWWIVFPVMAVFFLVVFLLAVYIACVLDNEGER